MANEMNCTTQVDEEPGPHYASFGSFGNLNAAQFNESGPTDEPKPHYVSGTSSFGNMGPLPPDNPGEFPVSCKADRV